MKKRRKLPGWAYLDKPKIYRKIREEYPQVEVQYRIENILHSNMDKYSRLYPLRGPIPGEDCDGTGFSSAWVSLVGSNLSEWITTLGAHMLVKLSTGMAYMDVLRNKRLILECVHLKTLNFLSARFSAEILVHAMFFYSATPKRSREKRIGNSRRPSPRSPLPVMINLAALQLFLAGT